MSDTRPASRSSLPAPHGQLEAIYRPRRGDADAIALLLHPHPLYGGTMHNKVIFQSAKALEDVGYETLRINFRGVGASTGEHDHGRGEIDDAATALDFLRKEQPRATHCLVLGFSFGAAIALALGSRDAKIDRLIAIGTPAHALSNPTVYPAAQRAVFIHGDRDEVAPLPALRQALTDNDIDSDLIVIPGADHFFTAHLQELRDRVGQGAVVSGQGSLGVRG